MTLNEYMKLPYRMEIVPDTEEGGYAVMFPELPGCVTCGETDYSGQFKLRIPKSLHRQLSEQSKREGISMNQYCLYLLSRNDAIHSQG